MDEIVPLPLLSFSGTIDQRGAQRVFCQRVVHLRASDRREFEAICTDVNLSGIGVDCDWLLAVGQRVELLLPGDQRVPMLVIYRMGRHYGLSVLGSSEAILELLPQQ